MTKCIPDIDFNYIESCHDPEYIIESKKKRSTYMKKHFYGTMFLEIKMPIDTYWHTTHNQNYQKIIACSRDLYSNNLSIFVKGTICRDVAFQMPSCVT